MIKKTVGFLYVVVVILAVMLSCTPSSPDGKFLSASPLVELKAYAEKGKEIPSQIFLRVLHIFEDGSFVGTDGTSAIFVPSSELALDKRYIGKVIKLTDSYVVIENGIMRLIVRNKHVVLDLTRNIPSIPEKLEKNLASISESELLRYDGLFVEVFGTIKPVLSSNGEVEGYTLVDNFQNEISLKGREYIEFHNMGKPFKVSIDGKIFGYLFLNRLTKRWELLPFGSSKILLNIPRIAVNVEIKLPILQPVRNLRGVYYSNERKLLLTWEYTEDNVEFFVYRRFDMEGLEAFELIGRTSEKSIVITDMSNHDSSTGYGVIAYLMGKESPIMAIEKSDIEER